MKRWQAAAFGLAVLFFNSACGESVVPTVPSPKESPRVAVPGDGPSRSVSIGSQTPPSSVPAAYQHYTWIDVTVDVGWYNANTAYAQAIVNFGANNASADIDLSVRNAQGLVIGSNHGQAQASYVFPGDHAVVASTNAVVGQTCGAIAQGTASGKAWDSFFTTSQSMLTWGQKGASESKTASQPACVPTTCLDASASNYNGPLPCTYPPPPAPSGGSGSTPPPDGGTTQPPTYQPAPFVPSGHWECYLTNLGTDFETERCTWYADYTRLPKSSPAFTMNAAGAASRTQTSADLPSVFVIVSDQVPADAIAVIERHKQGPYRNVLLVPSSTIRPAVLVAALRALADSRSTKGETPDKDLQLTLKGSILDQQIPAAARDYAATFAALIATAKRGDAGAYGQRPILEIRLGDKK
jgi:hypothetical protein